MTINDLRNKLKQIWGIGKNRIPTADEVLAASFDGDSYKIGVTFERTGLLSKKYDYLEVNYTTDTIEEYNTFLNGVWQERVTVTYTDDTKRNIHSVEKM